MPRDPTTMERRVTAALMQHHGTWLSAAEAAKAAVTAIRAMKQPTPEMDNVIGTDKMFGDGSAVENWQAMLDAASPEDVT